MNTLLFLVMLTAPSQAPVGWTCDAALFEDGTCDCGCDAPDADCAGESEAPIHPGRGRSRMAQWPSPQ